MFDADAQQKPHQKPTKAPSKREKSASIFLRRPSDVLGFPLPTYYFHFQVQLLQRTDKLPLVVSLAERRSEKQRAKVNRIEARTSGKYAPHCCSRPWTRGKAAFEASQCALIGLKIHRMHELCYVSIATLIILQ